MRVPPLAARNVEDPGANGKAQDLEKPRDLLPIALRTEEGPVLMEITRVEKRRPPVAVDPAARQKKTGSR